MTNMIAAIIGKNIQWCFTYLRIPAPPAKVTKPSNARIVIGVVNMARTNKKMKGNSSNNPSPTRAVPMGFL